MCPFTPHLAEEMWARLGHQTLIVSENWPVGDAALAQDDVVTIAVQICGKMRGTIEMPKDAPQSDVEAAALALENVKRQVAGMDIKRLLWFPTRLSILLPHNAF